MLAGHEEDEKLLSYVGEPISEEQIAIDAMKFSIELVSEISDLRKCILKSPAGISFFTSDNPATSSNKFMIQKSKQHQSWGIGSMGFYCLLPISPEYAFFAYDDSTYFAPCDLGIIRLNKRDVNSINSITFASSNQCVFYKDNTLSTLQVEKATKFDEAENHFRMNLAIKDENFSSGERFEIVDKTEFGRTNRDGLIHLQNRPPRVRTQPNFLRYKLRARGASVTSFGAPKRVKQL